MTYNVISVAGSVGQLAVTQPLGRMWVTPDSYFAVISPEAAAVILKRPPSQVRATTEQLRLRPQDLVELGIARGIAECVKLDRYPRDIAGSARQ